MDEAAALKNGRCRIKPGSINKLVKGINLKCGRGKNFDYKYISESKVIVYKKGINFMLNTKELEKYFYIY